MMTQAEIVVLSLIAEKPRHGYDLEREIDERGMREWTEIGFSSIYYLLNKLQNDGMLQSQLQPADGKGPARKVYQLTPAGRAALIEAALASLSVPHKFSSPFLVGLANYPLLDRNQLLAAIEGYAGHLKSRLDHMRQREEAQKPLPGFVEAMFSYSRVLVETELDWMQRFIAQVEAGNVES
jgi:DNA-binding PadR family transcriptional regulator